MSDTTQRTKFNFFCAGGVEQLSVRTAEDLAAVEALDPKLWLAISMPTDGIDFDARTLELIDSDGDGRIRVAEVKAAVAFVREHFVDFSSFFAGKNTFPLSAINPESPLAERAEKLIAAGVFSENEISAEAAQKAFKCFAARPFNGDGLITPASAEGVPETEKLIAEIAACCGAGADGISADQVKTFVAEAEKAVAWHAESESNRDAIFPIGDQTESAFAAIEAVRVKVDDFFARSRLAAYDPASVEKLNPSRDVLADLAQGDITSEATKAFPIARITSDTDALPLLKGVNPAWATALKTLLDKAIVPALGVPAATENLTQTQWQALLVKFEAYAAWIAKKPGGKITEISRERLREILEKNPPELLAPLFERDKDEAPQRESLVNIERLCLYSGNLLSLLRNYVSFADFYTVAGETIFLAGTLYIDSRECALCTRVKNIAAHAALAAQSNCYIAYCNCTRKSDGKTMTIAAVLGDGDADSLSVGRNGVFVDKNGDDWDASVAKILEQPISLRQAIWSPYKKLARFIETQVNNFAAAREKKVDENLSGGVGSVASSASASAAGTPPKPAFDIGKFVGIFAAIGLALGALGAALAALGSAFMSLAWWQMPLVILGILLLISVPSVIITAMKLRRRTLGPILDANSWAVNARAKVNIALGKAYTKMPKKPKGSRRIGRDPYAENKGRVWKMLLVLCTLAVAGYAAFCYLKPKEAEVVPATPPPAPVEVVPAA